MIIFLELMTIRNFFKKFSLAEKYTVAILLFYTLLSFVLLFYSTNYLANIAQNVLFLSIIFTISNFNQNNKYSLTIRKFYLLVFVYFIYNQTNTYITFINPNLYDELFIKIDRAICGDNPTHLTLQFANPYLTEFLQFCYMTFFFMPIIHGIELHIRKKNTEFDLLLRNILFGFYLSYLLYFFLPAIGPRFILHDFTTLSKELPGVFLTEFFRSVVNTGGGIINAAIPPEMQVHRDCMPSGHTMMTLINIYLSFKFKSKLRYVFLVIGSGLIFATVYLRYHYVIDVIAGAVFFYVSLKLEKSISKKVL